MATTTDFTQGAVRKPLLSFAIPILLSNILQQLYQIVDSIIVGRMIGPSALAAVSASTTVVMAVVIIMNGFAAGVSILTAQLVGAKKEEQITNLAYSTILIFSVACIALSVILAAFSEPFMRGVLGTPESILADSVSYFNIYIASLLFVFLYNIYSFMLRAYGNSNAPLYFLVVFAIVNVFLDIIFVGPLKMGVFGAGLATFISQALSAVLTMWYVKKYLPSLHIFKKGVRLDKELFKKSLAIGVPNAAQQLLLGMSNLFLQRLVNSFGTVTIAAQGIEYRISVVSTQIGNAFSRAISAFVGQNKGANRFDRIEAAERFLLSISIGIGVIMTVLVCVFDRGLASLFADYKTGDSAYISEVILQGGRLISLTAYSYIFMMIANVHIGVLRGAGDTMFTSGGTVFIVVIRIISAYFLANFTRLGYLALGVSMIIMWSLAMIGMFWRYKSNRWKNLDLDLADSFE